MTRLQSEWHRLYLPRSPADPVTADENTSLIDAQGRVRALVLTLARPADWTALSLVWQAVQADLALPAPAIAVSGIDSYQLWFSLAEPVSVPDAHAFLDALRARYLSDIATSRVGLLPATDADLHAPQQARHVQTIPGQQVLADQWSAFLAPDLAPMFADTPWLDLEPSPEGQADLLSGLRSIKPTAWQTALERLRPAPAQAMPGPASASSEHPGATGPYVDPRRFLLDVMNDSTVALALRIEAAKALLP